MKPYFSIIVPVYNVAPYLRECLDSVLAQTFTDWEAICVDDGSTDGSGAILDEYAAKDNRFRVFHQPNAGVSAARNKGIALSYGKYVSFLDSDDVIVPRWLATASLAINQTSADIVRLWLTYWDGSKPMPDIDDNNKYSIYEGCESITSWGWSVLLREGWSCLLFLRRESLATQDGLYPMQIGLREDNIFLLRQIKNFSKVCQVGYAGYLYRQRQNSSINRVHSDDEAHRFSHGLKNLWLRDRKMVRKSRQGLIIESMVRECIRNPYGPPRPNIVVRAARKLLRMIWPSRNNRCKSVCFITPGPSTVPVGGYKVVYEYANRLVSDGWSVAIVFPLTLLPRDIVAELLSHPRSTIKALIGSLKQSWRQKRVLKAGQFWFPLDCRVKCIYPWRIVSGFAEGLPKNTHFVSTYVTTTEALLQVRASKRYQLIQGREDWFGVSLNELYETYRYPMTKIVISKWLGDCVKEAGGDCVCIPNGLDFDYFRLNMPIAKRNRYEIAFLWHVDERKRTKDTTDALQEVRDKHPELHVTAFGVSMAPANLPEWITYIQKPDRECHNKIYNDAAIFVASSEQEGWGLTPCEAMQCGAAVACTDIGGYKMFAKDQETALLSPARDVKALADNICRLIEDDALRIRIAEAGHKNIQQFTWERSVALFEAVMEGKDGR